ncbi:MAG TPA: response regulator transcription factor [Candidatus Sulfomarinibacteraceae bacterium]|nr:response regulator transcription factor [Candidatus Sulfomarinibacteraceae bacterium]
MKFTGTDMELQQILAVDDNENMLALLEMILEQAGYEVLTATSATEALTLIKRRGVPHLALVDVNMPGMDGFDLAREIHESSELPVIFLTAVDQEGMVVEGLERYADDYIVKPFHVNELVARVQRVLRRVDSFSYRSDPLVVVDDRLQINFTAQEAIVDDAVVSLTPTEARLLDILVSNRGRTIPTERLLQRIWPGEDASEDRLYVAVYRLRQKLKGERGEWDYIVTRSGLGYLFQGPGD